MTPGAADPVGAQTRAVAGLLDAVLPPDTVVSLIRYGSAVSGGLRPDSDLDLFGVLRRRLTDGEKRALVDGLVPISWRSQRPPAWRPLELTLVVEGEVRPWRYPPRLEFQYGEWLRDELAGGNLAPWPPVNPDVALLVTMVRDTGVAVGGPRPADLLDPVPRADLVRAILDELPSLMGDLGSDTRNVLLTLGRMWLTVETGRIASKDEAARWAIGRVPERIARPIEHARDGYLGMRDDRWDDRTAARSAAETMERRIRRAAAAHPARSEDR